MSTEFEVGGNRYSADRIRNARLQTHVVRRLGPAAATALAAALTAGLKGGDAKEAFTGEIQEKVSGGPGMQQMAGVMHNILAEIAGMSDATWDYVQDACLAVVKRESGGHWAPVLEPRTKQLMFEDMDYQVILMCVWHALRENFTGFFREPPPTSSAPQGPLPPN